ncbi:MAG: folylpolyglutamate synthase/dihydrofolate synthase family protein [Candidatus Margulisiibacteriota bacterium]
MFAQMGEGNKYLLSLDKFGINLGLERIERLLKELGNPQLRFQSLHVAGTNGKGSTCVMIASILKESGYKVGLYTSPHLFDFRERIKINGRDISRSDFKRGLAKVEALSRSWPEQPTVFEVLTAVAFWYFAEKKIDYAVVEVGLGGRLDATNVLTPLVSVITNIDLEHKAVLGNTLAKIAIEKGGIIKPRVPVITGEQKPAALKVLQYQAEKNGSVLIQVNSQGAGLSSGLIGEHQKINAACALAAVRLAGIKADKEAILRGLARTNWPARFQVVARRPLTIVDGAHNPAGMATLVATLKAEYPDTKFTFIIGAQGDKDAAEMLRLIAPLAKKIIITRSSHRQAATQLGGTEPLPLKTALKQTAGEARVIAGSLFLAADALKLLDPRA